MSNSQTSFNALVLRDSFGDTRLTTMIVTYPMIIHAEMCRHRVFSRNTSSSRAIPVSQVIKQVIENPFIPEHWGAAQPGMQAYAEIPLEEQAEARKDWLLNRDASLFYAEKQLKRGLHKQIVNRTLAPWMWCTEVVSSVNWSNFFHLRCHEAAEPHMQHIAGLMRDEYERSKPVSLQPGQWHIPYDNDIVVTTGQLARASYNKSMAYAPDEELAKLHDRLMESGHWSPFEHCAQYSPGSVGRGGNFGDGWIQYRKTFAGECK